MDKREALLLIVVVGLILTSVADAGSGLVGWWKFDEISGTVAADYSGNGYNATVNKADNWDANGCVGGCLNFDGTIHVSVPNKLFSNIANEITLTVWVNDTQLKLDDTSLFYGERPLEVYLPQSGCMKFGAGYNRDDNIVDGLWDCISPEHYKCYIGRWTHYAFVKNEDEGIMRIYRNGKLIAHRGGAFRHIGRVDIFSIGSWGELQSRCYKGKLDDFRIYNYALSQGEINAIYMGSKLAKTIVTAIVPATLLRASVISEQSPKRESLTPSSNHSSPAAGHENSEAAWMWWRLPKLNEDETFGDGKYSITCRELSNSAHQHKVEFRIGHFAGDPADPNVLFSWETASGAYDPNELVEQISPSKDGEVVSCTIPAVILNSIGSGGTLQLVAKYQNDNLKDKHGRGSESYNSGEFKPSPTFGVEITMPKLGEWIKKADEMLAEKEHKAAVKFLEDKLSEYSKLRGQSHDISESDGSVSVLTALYFRLAKANEAAGASKENVAALYQKVVETSYQNYFLQEQIAAVIWLLANMPKEQHNSIVTSFAKNSDIENNPSVFTFVAEQCEENGDWDIFKRFLDLIFPLAKEPVAWAKGFESGLNKGGWKQKYLEYCEDKAELHDYAWDYFLREGRKTAKEQVRQGKFEEAIETYQKLIKKDTSVRYKAICELEICKCLFEQGDYKNAIGRLSQFIMDNKATAERALMEEAISTKGRCYIQIGDIDKALEVFLLLSVEYIEAVESPEINFLIGYCYMLQSKFKEAKEAFNVVAKDHPQSGCASKARLCLTRIESMTE